MTVIQLNKEVGLNRSTILTAQSLDRNCDGTQSGMAASFQPQHGWIVLNFAAEFLKERSMFYRNRLAPCLLFVISFFMPSRAVSQASEHRLILSRYEGALVLGFPLAWVLQSTVYEPDTNYRDHDCGWKNPVDERARVIVHNDIFQGREIVAQKLSDYLRTAVIVYPLLYFPRRYEKTYELHDRPLTLFADAKFFLSYAEAQAASFLITHATKYLTNRHRPWLAYENFDSPFYSEADRATANVSFFSGHASAAFAAASFHHRMLRRFQNKSFSHPQVWAPYAAASLTSLMRIGADKHYLTDVLTGAVVGTLAARWIVDLSDYEIIESTGAVGPEDQAVPLFAVTLRF